MIHRIQGIVWGPGMLFCLMAVGLLYSVASGFFQLRGAKIWWRHTVGSFLSQEGSRVKSQKRDAHSVTKIQTVCTALAATVGTGNIVGVATALTAGGAGAIFWMWISAGIGMMTAYAETSLGIRYRYRDDAGRWICGPMVYLERGLHLPWLAVLYSLLCIFSSLGMGSMVQSNAIAETLSYIGGMPPLIVGIILTFTVMAVICGGISRIASVSEWLMPICAGIYMIFSLIVIISCYDRLPLVLERIFASALLPQAALGGMGGYGISRSLRLGIARGTFSNEAGLGSLAILHGAAENTTPEEQGMWAMFEVFFDTMVICTMTAFVILCITNGDPKGAHCDGAALTTFCFEQRLGLWGHYLVSGAMLVFAFATIIAWFYLGRQALAYLVEQVGKVFPGMGRASRGIEDLYLILYLHAVFLGCLGSLTMVWELSDIWNGLLAIPNLLALVLLIGQVHYPEK
ncbi:MAG: sodium:alanine symporter family protein [Hungatella sp.]